MLLVALLQSIIPSHMQGRTRCHLGRLESMPMPLYRPGAVETACRNQRLRIRALIGLSVPLVRDIWCIIRYKMQEKTLRRLPSSGHPRTDFALEYALSHRYLSWT